MRFIFLHEIPFLVYKNVLHAHSHLALLGWGAMGLFTIFDLYFRERGKKEKKLDRVLFALLQLSITGAMFSFLLTGYSLYSAVFLTLFLMGCIFKLYEIFNCLQEVRFCSSLAQRLIYSSLFLFLLSFFGILGIVIYKTTGSDVKYYYWSIQFFLHFQLNGWLVFSILGFIFEWAARNKILFSENHERYFFWALFFSTLFTYALSVSWMNPNWIVYAVNTLGSLFSLATGLMLCQMAALKRKIFVFKNTASKFSFQTVIFGLLFKFFFISLCSIPYIASVSLMIRNFVIGFVHLLTIGILSFGLIGFTLENEILIPTPRVTWGVKILFIGFFTSEIILLSQGFLLWLGIGFIPNYYAALFAASLLIPLGIATLADKQKVNFHFD